MNGEDSSTENQSSSIGNPLKMSKRGAVVKERIQQFYTQLTDGCGRANCSNSDCASNPSFKKLSSDNAAARAITLFRNKVSLCDKPPLKIARKDSKDDMKSPSSSQQCEDNCSSGEPSNGVKSPKSSKSSLTLSSSCDSVGNSQSIAENGANNDCTDSCPSPPLSDHQWDSTSINSKLQNISVHESSSNSSSSGISAFPQAQSKSLPSDSEHKVLEALSAREIPPEDSGLASVKDGIWTVFSKSTCLNLFCVPTKEILNSNKNCDEDKDIDENDVKPLKHEKEQLSMDDLDENDVKPLKNGKEKLSMDDLDEDHESKNLSENQTASTTVSSKTTPVKKNSFRPTVDIDHMRSLYKLWSKYPSLERVMQNSVAYLLNNIEHQLSVNKQSYMQNPNYLNMFVLLIENPSLHSPEALEKTFPYFCKVTSRLPIPAQAMLARYWSEFDQRHLRNIVENLQQLITFKVVSEEESNDDSGQPVNNGIMFASKCLNILFYASILGGKTDRDVDRSGAEVSVKLRESSKTASSILAPGIMDDSDDNLQFTWVDPLGKELNINKLDSTEPVVPLSEFVNEPLNDFIKIDKDYTNYRISQQLPSKFSFLHYPFLLNTVSKTTHLFYDNRVSMYSERRRTVFSSLMQGALVHPYLKIQVRRSHIIEDTLIQLELATENVKDLKKQLYVEFDGEEGVDEGGVSKEFFQLVIDKIFNPENGMFVYNEDTHLFWFNPHSFEALTQYRLTGIVLGLAIYNNCILDVSFPSVVYKKLLGKKGKFHDLATYNPILHKSLQQLLTHEGNVEEDLMITFRVEYQDVFGTTHYHDLKEGGENLPVTTENRQEYVTLYSDWLLNTSISEQFNAFLSGFDLVVSESPLKYLFYPDELELLVRGSEDYDFEELERTTEYDGGFSKTSDTIVDFWSVVHTLTAEEKRCLLQFSTGSDRAPVGGLAKLKMIIARNGPDSNRLPTAHTCFNVILLPDYKNREKLRERLLKAIKYSKGFGML